VSVPLPPLPPVTGTDEYRPGGATVVALLGQEHHRLLRLCERATGVAGPGPHGSEHEQGETVEVLSAVVSRHLSGEQQHLFPAVRRVLADGEALAAREIAADQAILQALRELEATAPDDTARAAATARVVDLLRQHVRRLDAEILPALASVLEESDLVRLGNRVEIAEEAGPTRPHPQAPDAPPWNRVVEPALGMVDKVRDVVSGRHTRPEDLKDRDAG